MSASGGISLNGIKFFIKNGNNGTVSGDYYCRSSSYPGGTGSCVGVKRLDNGWYVDIYTPAGVPVSCLCVGF